MKIKIYFASAVIALLTGCAAQVNLTAFRTPYEQFFSATATSAQVHEAILQSAQALMWRIDSDKNGVMELTYLGAPRHELTVQLNYSNTYLAVDYVSSQNMKERMGCIDMAAPQTTNFKGVCLHKNAQVWVRRLLHSVSRKVNNGEI